MNELKRKFANKKIIPGKYELPILEGLSFYPELENVWIEFKLVNKHIVPYGTVPSFLSIFRSPGHRKYIVSLLEVSEGPEKAALFRNLPCNAQIGIIAHELAHVTQYEECSVPRLILTTLVYPFPPFQLMMESGADKRAIAYGAGELLYDWAVYIRSIPGYTRQSPRINKYYLKPDEILSRIKTDRQNQQQFSAGGS